MHKSPARSTRTRSQMGKEAEAKSADEEMAPNVNGNKDGVKEETTTAAPAESTPAVAAEEEKQEAAQSEVSSRVTRKRKLADIKSEEEDNKETATKEPETKQKPTTESVIVKEEPLNEATDSSQTSVESVEVKVETPTISTVAESTNNSISNDLKDIEIGIQTFGKGKRARVPNKRYSDISRVTPRAKAEHSPRKSQAAKNGEFPDDDLGEILREESEAAEFKEQAPVARRSLASSASAKKAKPTFDSTNPAYLKPFKFGWKRELVFRSTFTDGKRNGDIYYYTPTGKKVRSMREVAENLKNRELSINDFTFFKEPIGLDDPEKEIIRDAKKIGGSSGSGRIYSKNIAPAKLGMKKKRTKTSSVSSGSSPPAVPAPATKSKLKSSFKVKVPTKKMKKSRREMSNPAQTDAALMSPSANPSPAKKSKLNSNLNVGSKPCPPCSIRCEGVLGLVPTLQCHICLCLYHNECVGVPSQAVIPSYVCKNCQPEASGGGSETVEGVQQSGATASALGTEKTQVPTANTDTASNSTLNNNNKENKSLVGSVTTWFPPSSTIQVGGESAQSETNLGHQARRPQLVEYIGNKKYLVVPRHNVLNVKSPVDSSPNKEININSYSPKNPLTCGTNSNNETNEGPDDRTTEPSDERNADFSKSSASTAKLPVRSSERMANKAPPVQQMQNHLQNLAYGYKTLFYVFQYLKVQDLLRAGCVCTMWRDMARHPLLWRTVRMKNSQIHSFEGLANALEEHGTVHLDLRKMLLPANQSSDDIWPTFTNAIKKVKSLRRIELCRCLASVVEDLARNNHNLEVINAVTIKCETMTLQPLEKLTNLVDLRLKSTAGLTLTSDLSALKELTKLKHLSITSIKDLNKLNIEVIGELTNLEVLDLGECTDFPKKFGPEILSRLVNLEKLRLEKGHGECHTFDILNAVKDLPCLHQLELVNFDIKTGFDKALGACFNITKLLIIPTYVSQSATTNHMVLGGVLRLQKTLSHFVWGVTLELLRVTELFVDQCEQPDKKDREKGANSGDSIPVLKPVPLHGIQQPELPTTSDTPQVEILPLPNLQKLLLQNLPTTRVKILKIPFHATWRQSITDSVN